jgi:HAE1 family hydrophobic/amphiphilic exporter-1
LPNRRETLALTDYSLRRPYLVLAILCVILATGVISYLRLGVELFPPVHFPLVNVTVIDPGASPQEITQRLTIPVENALAVLPNITHVHSTILPGATIVTAVFNDSSRGKSPERLVKSAMDHLSPALPAGLPPPRITRENPTQVPLMWIIFPLYHGAGHDTVNDSGILAFLRQEMFSSLMRIKGVKSIRFLMPPSQEVHVYLRRKALEMTPISIGALADDLRNGAKEYPAGYLSTDARYMDLEAGGLPLSMGTLPGFPVLLPSGKVVRLGNISRIFLGESRSDYLFRFDGKPAVAFKVYSASGANLISLSHKIRETVKEVMTKGPFPSKNPPDLSRIRAIVRMDRSIPLSTNNAELLETLILGAVLAVLVILFFLGNIRETAVAALAIPASVLATFPLLKMAHFTLNNLTMLGLSLVVGILIDDAIVVLENINRHRMMGEGPYQAARYGVGEIGRAVLATTFSIVAVFAPVAMMHGVLGEFFTQFGWTVSFAVLASLLVSLSVIPILMMLETAKMESGKGGHLFSPVSALGRSMRDRYTSLLELSMNHPYALIAICGILFAGSLYLGAHLGWNLIPEEDQGEYIVHMTLEGSPSLEKTDHIASDISRIIGHIPGVLSVFHEVGGKEGTPPSEGYLYVNLVDRSKRVPSDLQYMEETRKILSSFKGVHASVDAVSPLGGTGSSSPFQCFLLGPDALVLGDLTKKVQMYLQSIEGLRDVRTSRAGSMDILRVRPADGIPAEWRISSGRLADWLSQVTEGRSGGRIITPEGVLNLRVSIDPSEASSPEQIAKLPFPISPTKTLPLRNIAKISLKMADQRQNRDDRIPSVTISANIKPPTSLGEVMNKLDRWAKIHLPDPYHIRYAGNSDVLKDARGQFSGALSVAVLVVFAVLSFQFNSLVLPFVIMISIPFGVVGAVLGLWISGIPVNIMSAIGLIILFGLVTKNAILLVDYANTLQKRGRSIRDAALESARVRLRPIAMTTFAMIFGMSPMAVGWGAGGAVRESMAIVVIGGLASSMFFTLFLVPIVYERVATLGKIEFAREEVQKQEEGGRG